ncbi:MAG: DEAD/DEAH box helicase [Candidatus Asgardarchaeia archaeon]
MKFEDMNIEKGIVSALNSYGLIEPTQIQKKAIPLIQQGFDVVGQSKTGSGKTAAFGVPLIEKIDEKFKRIQALVLSPTRELAQQIARELEKFSKFKRLNVVCIYGGVAIEPQIQKLRRAHIVVGTPGRILDHVRRGTVSFKYVRTFVLDEIDRMLDMGFIDDVESIIQTLPPRKNRQMLFFGATLNDEIIDLASRFSKNLKYVKTETKVSERYLKQVYYEVNFRKKFSLLVHLLNHEKPDKVIIFCNTRNEVDLITKNLEKQGFYGRVSAIHGGYTQSRRNKVIHDFYAGKIQILVATDVAGRGLDIDNVSHIINYDVPRNPEDYINRIGRTARAGGSGIAISLLSRDDYDAFRRIRRIYNVQIQNKELPRFNMLKFERVQFDRRRRSTRKRAWSEKDLYCSDCL